MGVAQFNPSPVLHEIYLLGCKLFMYLKERQIFHRLFLFPDTCNSQGLPRPDPGAWNSTQVSQVKIVTDVFGSESELSSQELAPRGQQWSSAGAGCGDRGTLSSIQGGGHCTGLCRAQTPGKTQSCQHLTLGLHATNQHSCSSDLPELGCKEAADAPTGKFPLAGL